MEMRFKKNMEMRFRQNMEMRFKKNMEMRFKKNMEMRFKKNILQTIDPIADRYYINLNISIKYPLTDLIINTQYTNYRRDRYIIVYGLAIPKKTVQTVSKLLPLRQLWKEMRQKK